MRRIGPDGVPIHVRDLGYVARLAETQTSDRAQSRGSAPCSSGSTSRAANTVDVVDQRSGRRCPEAPRRARRRHSVHHELRSVHLHPAVDREPLARGRSRGGPRLPRDPDLPAVSFTSTLIIFDRHPALHPAARSSAMYFLGQTINIFTLGGPRHWRWAAWSTTRSSSWRTSIATSPCPATRGGRRARRGAARWPCHLRRPSRPSSCSVPTVFLEGQAKLLFIPLTFTISVSLFASVPGLAHGHAAPGCSGLLQARAARGPDLRRLHHRVFRTCRSASSTAWTVSYERLLAVGARCTVAAIVLAR